MQLKEGDVGSTGQADAYLVNTQSVTVTIAYVLAYQDECRAKWAKRTFYCGKEEYDT